MSVVLGEPVPYYLELEALTDGNPRVRVTVYNIPANSIIQLRRQCEGETWIVPGVKHSPVSDVAVFVDWSAPLNRSTVYTVSVGGADVYSAAVTLPAESSWLQDPIRPDRGLPVYPGWPRSGGLSMANGAAKSASYPAEATQFQVLGDKYPRQVGGQRQAATDVTLPVHCPDPATNDRFLSMIESPVLLFRPVGRLRPFPPLAYLAAQVTEQPLDQHNGGSFTQWGISGNLVAAVVQAAITGQITYGEVQALLGQYTYGQVQAQSNATTYLDWVKNPLIFTTL